MAKNRQPDGPWLTLNERRAVMFVILQAGVFVGGLLSWLHSYVALVLGGLGIVVGAMWLTYEGNREA